MKGTGETFPYQQCDECGTLQIAEIPADLARYYGPDYYSFVDPTAGQSLPQRALKRVAKRLRDGWAVTGRGSLGRGIHARFPNEALVALQPLRTSRSTRILDVGCGSGMVVEALAAIGYRALLGVDPFLDCDREVRGVPLRKMPVEDATGVWDIVTFHHSFEHVPDPAETLASAARRLAPNGTLVLRIPTVSSWAWEHYGVEWAQLDAPRHLHLFSLAGIERLAARVGMCVTHRSWDSGILQFWGSEQIRQGIPLLSESSWRVNPLRSPISANQIQEWEVDAARLNREGRGDQIVLYLCCADIDGAPADR